MIVLVVANPEYKSLTTDNFLGSLVQKLNVEFKVTTTKHPLKLEALQTEACGVFYFTKEIVSREVISQFAATADYKGLNMCVFSSMDTNPKICTYLVDGTKTEYNAAGLTSWNDFMSSVFLSPPDDGDKIQNPFSDKVRTNVYYPNVNMKENKPQEDFSKFPRATELYKIGILHPVDDGIVETLVKEGKCWEDEVYQVMRELTDEDSNVIDVGSNIGYHTIRLAPYVKSVLSVEAHPVIASILEESIKRNNINNITVAMGAFYKKNMQMNIKKKCTGGNYGLFDLKPKSDSNSEYTINCVTGDAFCKKNTSGVDYDLIKIDTRGTELEVLLGMEIMISDISPYLIFPIETGIRAGGYTDLMDYIKSMGYTAFVIDSDYPCDILCVHQINLGAFTKMYTDRIEKFSATGVYPDPKVIDCRRYGIEAKFCRCD